jgi:hypothetical protein
MEAHGPTRPNPRARRQFESCNLASSPECESVIKTSLGNARPLYDYDVSIPYVLATSSIHRPSYPHSKSLASVSTLPEIHCITFRPGSTSAQQESEAASFVETSSPTRHAACPTTTRVRARVNNPDELRTSRVKTAMARSSQEGLKRSRSSQAIIP